VVSGGKRGEPPLASFTEGKNVPVRFPALLGEGSPAPHSLNDKKGKAVSGLLSLRERVRKKRTKVRTKFNPKKKESELSR